MAKIDGITRHEIERSSEVYLIWLDEEGDYTATCTAWPALSAFAETPEDALTELQAVIEAAKEIKGTVEA